MIPDGLKKRVMLTHNSLAGITWYDNARNELSCHSEPISERQREREKGYEGSLTSLAKQVFLPHI